MPPQLVFSLMLLLGVAFLLSEFCRMLRIPRVVGHVSAGVLFGIPLVKSQLVGADSLGVLGLLAELGMVLLFFFVGLEINFREFRKNFRESAYISLFNTALPFLAGLALMQALGFPIIASLVVGISLAVSAQSVSVDMLEEMKLLKSKIAWLIITAGAVDDVFELVLISGLLAVIHASIAHLGLAQLSINLLLFTALLLAFRYYLIPLMLKPFEGAHSSTSLFSGALIISLFMSTLSSLLGLGTLVGAISSGMALRQVLTTGKVRRVWEERSIAHTVHTVAFGFLVPLFFVWVGLNTELPALLENPLFTLLLIVIAFVGTIGGTVLGALASGHSAREGFIVGWGVNPKGDVELVIATLALRNGMISQEVFSSIIVMALATTLISPIVFRKLLEASRSSRASAQKS